MRIQELLFPAALLCLINEQQQQHVSAFTSPSLTTMRRTTTATTTRTSPLFTSTTDSTADSTTDSTADSTATTTTTTTSNTASSSLPELFPVLANSLTALGFATPTPIQAAAATILLAKGESEDSNKNENLMLIAPTGSGKTLAYLLPALTKAIQEQGTILMVAPTRELAVQLLRDAMSLLETLTDEEDLDEASLIALSIRGIEWPTPSQLEKALLLVGTPDELLATITNVKGGYDFCASLSAVVLDEVDVLLPLPPKILRTALDIGSGDKKKKKSASRNTPQDERRRQEQRRKLMAAKRKGTEIKDSQLVSSTEKVLNIVASARTNDDDIALQVLAGSATASRKTLDRLNRALRVAAVNEASSTLERVFGGDMKVCRPAVADEDVVVVDVKNENNDDDWTPPEQPQHTIRAVSVPEQVKHSFVALSKEQAASSTAVLAAVAKVSAQLKPETALLFICGEFGKSNKAAPTVVRAKPKGATNKSRRNSAAKQKKQAANANVAPKSKTEVLSARQACATLGSHGITAQPLHVALGLEGNTSGDNDDESPFLVTFEGSARGLHFEGVDVVFVVGRPASAASYLHLAGRVGRSSPSDTGEVIVRPGTVVSICTKGSATELAKWTKQVGATQLLEEIVL